MGHKFEEPHIEKIWVDEVGPHDWMYQAHMRVGHPGNFHHVTVIYEIRGHHAHHAKVT